MALRYLKTRWSLLPGVPSTSTIRELLRRFFTEGRWFQPVRYGSVGVDEQCEPGSFDLDALAAYYDESKRFFIGAKTDRDFIHFSPERHGKYPFIGSFSWYTSIVEARKARWREAHLRQVVEIMHLLGAPLAQAGLDDDFQRKRDRIEPNEDGFGSKLVFNLRDYSEGLEGLYWRNVFGAPFVDLFGPRLDAIPASQRQSLDGGLVLVQPYELPTQAMTPEGDAAEGQLIATLGRDAFFDLPTLTKPTRVPDVSWMLHKH
ncbi:hypothetical protein D7W82_27485 [Corallococcus sp. CA049B]|uniref:hypothetical protein n=1 Tax=Corallococcus sp. CA049B TaxID=2316730 RepID=UPI000EA06FCC|nr:hypothetical protein [Corallococcus sp. CA049B]NOJ96506.1 hypothetical protein [Corallococcus coralloides]RKG81835.1 hypothetical protein D7W82_27485 [Corallococcus sp. CA049B]